jgi:hypothetical protein
MGQVAGKGEANRHRRTRQETSTYSLLVSIRIYNKLVKPLIKRVASAFTTIIVVYAAFVKEAIDQNILRKITRTTYIIYI